MSKKLPPLTELEKIKVRTELDKARRERYDFQKEIDNAHVYRPTEFALGRSSKLSPKQKGLFRQLFKKELLIEGYENVLNNDEILGVKELILQQKSERLRTQLARCREEIDNLLDARLQISSFVFAK